MSARLVATGLVAATALLAGALPSAAHAAAPANDMRANASQISIGDFVQEDNTDATINPAGEVLTSNDGTNGCQPDGTRGPNGNQVTKTVWWTFVGDGEDLTVSTTLSNFDTIAAVYTQATDGLVLEGCNDDAAGGELGSEVVIPTDDGVRYWIQVGGCDQCATDGGGFTPDHGTIGLLLVAPPPNDDRANASSISVGENVDDFTFGALSEQGETLTCGSTTYDKTVWYRVTTSAQGTMTVSASGFPLAVSAYRTSGSRVGCNGGSGSSAVLRSTHLPAGTYLIQVGGRGESTGAQAGELNLRVDLAPDPPPDRDGDTIIDSLDKCPDVSSIGRDADHDGCPDPDLDPDHDGVPVAQDKCPTENASGRDANHDGCLDPAPHKRISADAKLRATPTSSGLKLVYLRVIAPKGSKITVRCGSHCRFAKRASVEATAARTVTIKKLAGRTFRAGQRIRIYVTRKNRIGVYIEYRISRGGFKRVNRCLNPGSTKPRKRCL
jgi:hypothetical protein